MACGYNPTALLLAGVEIEQDCRTLAKTSKATTFLTPQLEHLIFPDSLKRFGDAHPSDLFTKKIALAGDLWVSFVDKSYEY